MAFFPGTQRVVTVRTNGMAGLDTMTRAYFQRMKTKHPKIAETFKALINCVLADLLAFSKRPAAVLV
jgi:hypothetical protein